MWPILEEKKKSDIFLTLSVMLLSYYFPVSHHMPLQPASTGWQASPFHMSSKCLKNSVQAEW